MTKKTSPTSQRRRPATAPKQAVSAIKERKITAEDVINAAKEDRGQIEYMEKLLLALLETLPGNQLLEMYTQFKHDDIVTDYDYSRPAWDMEIKVKLVP